MKSENLGSFRMLLVPRKKLFKFIKSEVVEITEFCSIKSVWRLYELVWNKLKANVSQRRETDVHLPIAREWGGGLLGAAFQYLQGGNQADKAQFFTQMLRGRIDKSHPLNWGRFHLDLIRGKKITVKLIKNQNRVQWGWGISASGGFQDVIG